MVHKPVASTPSYDLQIHTYTHKDNKLFEIYMYMYIYTYIYTSIKYTEVNLIFKWGQ